MINTELLKKEIKEQNISLTELSKISGVDKSSISRVISGESKTCTVETAQKLSIALKLNATKSGLIFFAKEVAETQHKSNS